MAVTLLEIARLLDARVVAARSPEAVRIERVYAGDRISDLLEQASESTLLVTNLASLQLMRLADVMDVPAVCLLNGAEVDPAIAGLAAERGTALLVSPAGMFETCGRLYPHLTVGGGPA